MATSRSTDGPRSARHRAILTLIEQKTLTSQGELAARLRELGFPVTQATVSRDVADLGLVKAPLGDRHIYVSPHSLGTGTAGTVGGVPAGTPTASGTPAASGTPTASGATNAAAAPQPARTGTARLARILAEYPVRIARSGLSLVLVSTSGTANVIAQAIDESGLDDQVGTLAGDNTLLVLFGDEAALERWRTRFAALAAQAAAGGDAPDLAGTYP